MDSFKMATSVEASNDPRDSQAAPHRGKSAMLVAPRIKAALSALLEAFEYMQDLQRSTWDFAVEISTLRRLCLSNSDLRWLIGKGLIEHAVEVTLVGDSERSFRRPIQLVFCKKTCFVLTPEGVRSARELCGRDIPVSGVKARTVDPGLWPTAAGAPEPLIPKWDRDRQELTIALIVVKRFKVPAANQEAVLAAFEEESWPPRIDDPLSPRTDQPPKRRLQETIKSLNRNQKRPLIRFLGDGSGEGVRWEFCGDASEGT
jgi:hypothetical protein